MILISNIGISQSKSFKNFELEDSDNDDDNSRVKEERRNYNLDQLRRFLLTANAEQRAAKREQQYLSKRELVSFFLE